MTVCFDSSSVPWQIKDENKAKKEIFEFLIQLPKEMPFRIVQVLIPVTEFKQEYLRYVGYIAF